MIGSAALVDQGGGVVNVIVVETVKSAGYEPPEGLTLVYVTPLTGPAYIGGGWDAASGTFTPPPEIATLPGSEPEPSPKAEG